MKIEVYQDGKKVTDINLSNSIPAEIWLISSRHLIYKPIINAADHASERDPLLRDVKGDILHISEGDKVIDPADDRSR